MKMRSDLTILEMLLIIYAAFHRGSAELRLADDNLSVQPSPWETLHILPKRIGYMAYRDYHVSIFESLDSASPSSVNSKRRVQFFVTPIALLLHETARYQYRPREKVHEVAFDVLLYNDDIQKRVIEYLNSELNTTISPGQVQPIPFEEISLSCSAAKDACNCLNVPIAYHLHRIRTFKLVCSSAFPARELVDSFHTRPGLFESTFKIHAKLSETNSQSRDVVISMDDVFNGNLFTKLDRRFARAEEVLLTYDDVSRLVSETARHVLVVQLKHTDMVSEQTVATVERHIEGMLFDYSKVTIDESNQATWDSVFWDPDHFRPDLLASQLTELAEANLETRDHLIQAVLDANKKTVDHSVYNLIENLNHQGSERWRRETNASVGELSANEGSSIPVVSSPNDGNLPNSDTEEVRLKLTEGLQKIQWLGEQFFPKPTTLKRLNLSKLCSKQNFRDQKVSVSFSSATLSMPVNIGHQNHSDNVNFCDKVNNQIRQLQETVAALNVSLSRSNRAHSESITELEEKIGAMDGSLKLLQRARRCHGYLESKKHSCIELAGKCYCISNYRAKWTDAESYCKSNGANLLSLETSYETGTITNYLSYQKLQVYSKVPWFWTSGKWNGTDFLWTGSNHPFTYTSWRFGQPNDKGGESCVFLNYGSNHAGRWYDFDCSKEAYFVCEL